MISLISRVSVHGNPYLLQYLAIAVLPGSCCCRCTADAFGFLDFFVFFTSTAASLAPKGQGADLSNGRSMGTQRDEQFTEFPTQNPPSLRLRISEKLQMSICNFDFL